MPFRKPNQSTPLPNAGLAAVAAHEAEADPHGQYFLADGTRAMSGDIDVGANNITNVGDVVGAVMDSDFAGSATGVLRRTGAGAYAVRKDNLTAIVAPSIGDNNAAGYSHGSIWFDTVLLLYHIYQTETAGDAVWLQLGSGGGYDVEVDTLAELYDKVNAAGANVAQGNSWHITPDADANAERSGFFDSDGIDGLSPHPFETSLNGEFFPLNSNTMEFGVVSDGQLEILDSDVGSSATLTATAILLSATGSGAQSEVRLRFPSTTHRPMAVLFRCKYTHSGTYAVARIAVLRTADPTPLDEDGTLCSVRLSTSEFRSISLNDGGFTASPFEALPGGVSGTKIVGFDFKIDGAAYYTFLSFVYVEDSVVDSKITDRVVANNDTVLTDPNETFLLDARLFADVSPATATWEIEAVRIIQFQGMEE